ncbi:hypothetical protein [Rhodoferax sp.]|uniref:hypothetical protein n=1 Tax=Rhodoferax sp. TaxID=50421 RepID=UPI002ACDB691|nr:hypothetical protein [Rhodoferax sp.]MDZ7920663.1 hypothetical protein [Rhodoferax sp.]
MLILTGEEFMVGFGGGTVGMAVNPPGIMDGKSPIPYIDLTPGEAEQLAELLVHNAKLCRASTPQ